MLPGKFSFFQLGVLVAQVPLTLPDCQGMYACFSCLEFLYLVHRTTGRRGWVVACREKILDGTRLHLSSLPAPQIIAWTLIAPVWG